MDLRNVVLWIIILAVDIMISVPFIRIYDRQLQKDEAIASTEA
jgi:cellobiose-specific phosphotransferase system component IIC